MESKLSSPILWSPESPKLYKLVTTVSVGDKIVDRKETPFGIRTVGFDADERLFAERQALRDLRHLQSSGPRRRRRGHPGCVAGISREEIEGIRLQRHPHLAQSAHAGIARCLRPARHVGHGREPVDGQRFGEHEKVGRPNPPRPQSSECRDLVHRQRAIRRARHAASAPTSRARCRITSSNSTRRAPSPTPRRKTTCFAASIPSSKCAAGIITTARDMDRYHAEHPTSRTSAPSRPALSARAAFTRTTGARLRRAYDVVWPGWTHDRRKLVELLRRPSVAFRRVCLDRF